MQFSLIQYIDFTSICNDYNLKSGDISPNQQIELEIILQQFINQNK
jgi:hypothetical protein